MSAARQVHITQGTPEWLEWRKPLITASDVSALFDKNDYKSETDLWFEKSGFGEADEEDRSYIFREGHKAEAELRALFKKHEHLDIKPACFEKDEIFGASLDGYFPGFVFEAKLVGLEVFQKAEETGEIPEAHWIQIQSQLHASESDKAVWGAKTPKRKDKLAIEIGRDEPFIKLIRDKTFAFMEKVRSGKKPELSQKDILFITDPAKIAIFRELAAIKARKDEIDAEYAKLEAQVEKMASHPRVRCENVHISVFERAGSIDYKKVPEVKALDEVYLEKFRGKSSLVKQIRFTGDKNGK